MIDAITPGKGCFGKCSVPMFGMGTPAGICGKDAFGVYIQGETFRDGQGVSSRFDGKYNGYVPGLACPRHGGPKEVGPRVFQDGFTSTGRPMWCAVYESFVDLQESPAEFHEHAWLAVQLLLKNSPRSKGQIND